MPNTNGTVRVFKWIGGIIAVTGFLVTAAGLVWNASTLSSTLVANCKDDAEVHGMTRRDHDILIQHGKDIESLQKNVLEYQRQILDGQKAILQKLANP